MDTMGVSGKWIKALVGLKKSEKSGSSKKEEKVAIFLTFNLLFDSGITHYSFLCSSMRSLHWNLVAEVDFVGTSYSPFLLASANSLLFKADNRS